MRYYKTIAVSLFLIVIIYSCQTSTKTTSTTAENKTTQNDTIETEPQGIKLSDMDLSVDPAENFYTFANGGWLESTEIPGDEGRWSSFNELRDYNNNILLEVLNTARESGKYKAGSDEMKAFTFYQVAIDSLLAEKKGLEPLQPLLNKINSIQDKQSILPVFVELRKKGVTPFFGMYVSADRKESDKTALHLIQGGLGMPNRDYYVKTDAKANQIKEEYLQYIKDMLSFIGYSQEDAAESAINIMQLESELAEASMDNVERRDPEKTYNKFEVEDLVEITPSIDWNQFLSVSGISNIDSVIVGQPEFLKMVNQIVTNKDLSVIKDYLKWNIINTYAAYLNHAIVNRNFQFYGKVLQGTDEMRPRWKRALATTNNAVGFAVGKLYVDETFPPEAKEKAEEMVSYIKKAFSNRINQLEWMSNETKEKAQEKLNKFNVKIGYPEEWKTYEELEVANKSYVDNVIAANIWSYNDNIEKLNKPVDKTEWFMTPQTVNAYYSPTFNEIVFPAGILQPPFYNYQADAAVNFGGIGAVIGHEISHGFDDNGSKYDGEGNLKNWWQEEDYKQFQARTNKLVEQYDSYEPLDSVFVSGKFTLGENIGDLGGVASAYDGLKLYLQDNGYPAKTQGFTPEQRFFISWATIWRSKYKDESLRNQVLTDPHAPGMFRAVGPLINIDGFYNAFNIRPGDAMYIEPDDRVYIW